MAAVIQVLQREAHKHELVVSETPAGSPWSVDAALAFYLACAAPSVAMGLALDGELAAANSWLDLSYEAHAAVAPNTGLAVSAADVVLEGCWMESVKVAHAVLDRSEEFERVFEQFVTVAAASPEFVALIAENPETVSPVLASTANRTETGVEFAEDAKYPDYAPELNDSVPLASPTTAYSVSSVLPSTVVVLDAHLCAGRVWMLARLAETEIAVLQQLSLKVYVWPQLKTLRQPDLQYISEAFRQPDGLAPPRDFSAVDVMLTASRMYYGRFDHAQLPREVVVLYLTLYARLNAYVRPAVEAVAAIADDFALYLPVLLAVTEPTASGHQNIHLARGESHYPPLQPSPGAGAALAAMLPIVKDGPASLSELVNCFPAQLVLAYLSVRWLSIVRLDGPHYPALRAAHYFLLVISVFNLFHSIVGGRASQHGLLVSLPPVPVAQFMELFLRGSQLLDVLHLWYILAYQAVFLAVILQAVPPNLASMPMDLEYVTQRLARNIATTLLYLSACRPYCEVPGVVVVGRLVEALLAYAQMPRVAPLPPHVAPLPPHAPLSALSMRMDSSVLVNLLPLPLLPPPPVALLPSPPVFASLIDFLGADNVAAAVNHLFGSQATFSNHVTQLWRMAVPLAQQAPVHVTPTLVLDTAFVRYYETLPSCFLFGEDAVNEYVEMSFADSL